MKSTGYVSIRDRSWCMSAQEVYGRRGTAMRVTVRDQPICRTDMSMRRRVLALEMR